MPIFFTLGRLSQESVPARGLLWHFATSLFFLRRGVVSPLLAPTLEHYPLSVERDCLLNTFAATLHIWRPYPPSVTWGCDMPRWPGIYLTWRLQFYLYISIWQKGLVNTLYTMENGYYVEANVVYLETESLIIEWYFFQFKWFYTVKRLDKPWMKNLRKWGRIRQWSILYCPPLA
jgi:hypothetical protein